MNPNIKNVFFILVGFLLLFAGQMSVPALAVGNIYYVDANNGSDANTGSFSEPWETLSNSIPKPMLTPTMAVMQTRGASLSHGRPYQIVFPNCWLEIPFI
jgi:hypothetical protein